MIKKILSTLLLLLLTSAVFAADKAAHVADIKGKAWVKSSTSSALHRLNKDDFVYPEDTLVTAKKSTLDILFTDGSQFSLGASTKMEISDYQYKKNEEADSFSSRIFKGTFRFVSGLIAGNKRQAMNVNLPVATIGIRGTHVAAEVTATSAKIILLEPEDQKPTAIEVSNEFGSTLVDKVGYGTEVPDEFSPPSPMKRMQVNTINNLMRSIQNSQRVNIPRPRL